MESHARQAGFAGQVSLGVVRSCLQRLVEADAGHTPLASGTVTFCGMLPVRGIPFEVVCLVGMNDGAFPHVERTPGFDLMREEPRPGDRSRRQDDRSLFLEALLAARRALYVSYVGQDIRENSPLPPSVLVSELLDYIERGFVSRDPSRPIRERLVTKHPLQPFSSRYFRGDDPFFSYAVDLCEASRVAAAARRKPARQVRVHTERPADRSCAPRWTNRIARITRPSRFAGNRRGRARRGRRTRRQRDAVRDRGVREGEGHAEGEPAGPEVEPPPPGARPEETLRSEDRVQPRAPFEDGRLESVGTAARR